MACMLWEDRRHAAIARPPRAADVLAELVSVATADKVYSEPVVAGDRTIITAAEIHTGMGRARSRGGLVTK